MRIGAFVTASRGIHVLSRAVYGEAVLRQSTSLCFTRSWEDLLAECEAGSFDAVIVQVPTDHTPHPESDWPVGFEGLRSSLGSGSVVAFFCDEAFSAQERRYLADAGFPFVISNNGSCDSATILRLLARLSIYRTIQQAQAPLTSQGELLQAALGWPPVSSVEELAGALHLSSRSLRRKTRALVGVSPRQVVRWTRLFEAASLSELGVASRSQLALLAEAGTSSSLCRLCRDLTGKPLATVLQSEGPVTLLRTLFRDRFFGPE